MFEYTILVRAFFDTLLSFHLSLFYIPSLWFCSNKWKSGAYTYGYSNWSRLCSLLHIRKFNVNGTALSHSNWVSTRVVPMPMECDKPDIFLTFRSQFPRTSYRSFWFLESGKDNRSIPAWPSLHRGLLRHVRKTAMGWYEFFRCLILPSGNLMWTTA